LIHRKDHLKEEDDEESKEDETKIYNGKNVYRDEFNEKNDKKKGSDIDER